MAATGKRLSLIILTYESERHIFECLASVARFNDLGDELEVIVVDNDSPGQAAMFSALHERYPLDLRLIASPRNGGYGYGNNLGVRHATADRFIVMNPDIRLIRPIFRDLLALADSDPTIGAIGVGFADGSHVCYYMPEQLSLPRAFLVALGVLPHRFDMQRMSLQGSFMLFDKAAFLAAGGYDERIFMYHEEPDIAHRLLAGGKRIVLAQEIQVFHHAHHRSFNERLATIQCDSLIYYLRKYGGSPQRALFTHWAVGTIKRWVAWLTGNAEKRQFFEQWTTLLLRRMNHLRSRPWTRVEKPEQGKGESLVTAVAKAAR